MNKCVKLKHLYIFLYEMKNKLNFKKYNKTYKVYGLALKEDKQDI